MLALILSLLALLSAPLLERSLRRPAIAAALDGFTATIIGGIVLLHVLPHGLEAVGWPALAALGLGLLLPAGCGRVPGGRGLVRLLATLALLAHGLLDGVALASDSEGAGTMLAEAVVLHSLPVGLAIWRMGGAEYGRGFAAWLLGLSAVAELAGFLGAMQIPPGAGQALAVVQCLAAGSLLHVVSHGEAEGSRASGVGALVGVGAVLLLAVQHPVPRLYQDELEAGAALWRLVIGAAPALVAGLALAVAARRRAPRLSPEPLVGLALGLALLPGLTGVAWAAACLVAASLAPRVPGPVPGFLRAAREITERATPWLIVGFGLAALAEPLLPVSALRAAPLGVVIAALLGEIVTLDAVAAAPILAMMVHKGVPPGIGLALAIAAMPPGPGWRRLVKLGLAVGIGLALLPLSNAPSVLHGAGRATWPALAALALVLVAGLSALFRQGVSGLIEGVLHPDGHADHAEHGHHHE